MKVAHNYSGIKNRDKKIYSVSGTKVSSTGLSYQYLKILSALLAVFNTVGALICLVTGKFLYWPITSSLTVNPTFLFIFVGIPFGLTMLLLYAKVQNYTLLEFLMAYFKPKRTRDEQGKVLKYSKHDQDTFVERVI